MSSADPYQIVSTQDRPDFVPLVADWLWQAFWRVAGHGKEDVLALVTTTIDARSMPRSFVMLADGVPVGTASLAASDLDTRPDLTPWLAGVYVVPEARGRGLAAHLVAAVEAEAMRQSFATLWLYTGTAERIYQRIGWNTVETFDRKGRPQALMRRDLAG